MSPIIQESPKGVNHGLFIALEFAARGKSVSFPDKDKLTLLASPSIHYFISQPLTFFYIVIATCRRVINR